MSKQSKIIRLLLCLLGGVAIWSCTFQEKPPVLKIAYNVWYDTLNDNYEIFVMDQDGKNPKNITNWEGVDWVYYAYKDKIYFISDRDTTHRNYFLYEMDVNGENVRRISNILLVDSWFGTRNEGSEIVVTSKDDGEKAFYILGMDGEVKAKLRPELGYINDPIFSPDGKQILFRGSKDKFSRERKDVDELYRMNADGTNLKRLTHYPASDTTADWYSYHAGPPCWDANTNTISYMAFQKGNYSIFTIKPDGTDVRQLTDDSMNQGYHAWSPDGKWIVFDGSDLQNEHFDIYLMKSDGTEIQKLTTDWRTEQAPVFVEVKQE